MRGEPDPEGYSAGGDAGAGRRGAGSPAGSWRRSPVWTTYVPLDHLRAVGPLMFRWTTWFTKYGGPTEHMWSNRTQVVQAERPRHDMRDTAPPCGTIGERNEVERRNRPSSGAASPITAPIRAHEPVTPGRLFRGGFEDVEREGRGDGPVVGTVPRPTPLRPCWSSCMVGRRLACRDAAGSRARHLTREIVT